MLPRPEDAPRDGDGEGGRDEWRDDGRRCAGCSRLLAGAGEGTRRPKAMTNPCCDDCDDCGERGMREGDGSPPARRFGAGLLWVAAGAEGATWGGAAEAWVSGAGCAAALLRRAGGMGMDERWTAREAGAGGGGGGSAA